MIESKQPFTGRRRAKKTPWHVKATDIAARTLITVGGIGTVVAVSTVFIFLAWVVVPLFGKARVETLPPTTPRMSSTPWHLAVDEYRLLCWTLDHDGSVAVYRLDTMEQLSRQTPFTNRTLTAISFAEDGADAAFGFEDGSLQFGRIGFRTTFLEADDAPAELLALGESEFARQGEGMVQRISPTQFRVQSLHIGLDAPLDAESPGSILRLTHYSSTSERILAVLQADNHLRMQAVRERKNILTGKVTYTRRQGIVPYAPPVNADPPAFMLLGGLGDNLILAWPDGTIQRYLTRDLNATSLDQTVKVLDTPGTTLTTCRWLLGRTTLLTGDSAGNVGVWFTVNKDATAPGESATPLVAAHRFIGHGAAVRDIAISSLIRMIAIGYDDGMIQLRHVTSHKVLADLPAADGSPVTKLLITPKDDGLLALSSAGVRRFGLTPQHPEATVESLFQPIWYESAPGPEHVWQSSSGTDDFEPKFGLMPLIFGTIKATVFSLLFGVPIALLAAIFTSEFLSGRVKSGIKPVVEMMASLPSVVLGFLAALVFAPRVADALPLMLLVFVTVPLMFMTGAYLWQLLPHRWTLIMQPWRFWVMFLMLPLGLLLARALAPTFERLCMAGDSMRWLDGQVGGAAGGWAICLFPLIGLAVAWGFGIVVAPWLRRISRTWSRTPCALADLGQFLVALVATLLFTAVVAHLLAAAGVDPRGGIFDTYVQRNALVVGFVMGFAVIPIIYTIAEDALTAVPEHLRSASLASGATPWQTATRIIVPTAMSGLFSAIMIGLGRAVGETMIVLMAAGNTPIMEWNLFNGFRTLSANIAVELPEAVHNSTHYRTLFLAALTLFVMTFILNTVAETIRLRFRKRAFQL